MTTASRRGAQHPIVLAHGYVRFDVLLQVIRRPLRSPRALASFDRALGDRLHYFRYVARALREGGFEVHAPSVSFAGSMARRAADLREAVERILAGRGPGAKVHIIGHSMGGLDARCMIALLGMGDRVASLTTIGTPHLGTSVAEWRLEELAWPRRAIRLLETLGIDGSGAFDLTRTNCARFNTEVEAAEAANAVTYIAWASSRDAEERVFLPLRRAWRILRAREGPGDGLVSVASQHWHPELRGPAGTKRVEHRTFPFPADHLNQCAWWHPWTSPLRDRHPFEQQVRALYVQIAEDLRARFG